MVAATPALKALPVLSVDELLNLKKDSLPTPRVLRRDPMNAIEMALEVEVERTRAIEALSARDAAIERLSEAYVSLRQKTATIERLQQTQTQSEQVSALEGTVKTLRDELASARTKATDPPPPSYHEVRPMESLLVPNCNEIKNGIDHTNPGRVAQLIRTASDFGPSLRIPRELPAPILPPTRPSSLPSGNENAKVVLGDNDLDHQIVHTTPKSSEPEDIIKARNALLAAIPLPADPPDDTLKPIVLPPPFTLHEFLANATGPLRTVLANYRVLQELTTSWCPDREEHGYMLIPLFKCSTNPRVATAHRWNMVDVMSRLSKPTECFYNKNGNWYYAGVYRAFRLDDLTTKEWEALSTETTQALVKDTIAGRKNTSPQNLYETAQLYAAGALKVACIGLQCVGFNKTMYHAVLEQAAKCVLTAKLKGMGGGTPPPPPGVGLGVVGGAWNAAGASEGNVNANGGGVDGAVSGMAGLAIGSENVPVQGGKGKK
ncbi:hypothetical protein R3P38DRAFT_3263460 [Favolaschia claudopus]|uniref:DUF6697 domain-containing protein n=1 Tax=Favolaschia claudopus TaxID=2862362 RepID=A0AAW0CAH5_9AGAR